MRLKDSLRRKIAALQSNGDNAADLKQEINGSRLTARTKKALCAALDRKVAELRRQQQ